MSKTTFTSILKSQLPECTAGQLSAYWEMAQQAKLPARIFDMVLPALIRLPEVHHAYQAQLGYSPIIMNEEIAERLILESMVEGPRYMSEIQKLFSIPAEMRRNVLEGLVKRRYVLFEFCPIGECMVYELNPRFAVPLRLRRRIDALMDATDKMSLYQLSIYALDFDYFLFCVLARNVLASGCYKYDVEVMEGKVFLTTKGGNCEAA